MKKSKIFKTHYRFLTALSLCLIAFATQATGLPTIHITTLNQQEITNHGEWINGGNMTSFILTDPNNPGNNVSRVDISPNLDRIRGRGNSTWDFPKKPYRVRFRENFSLFGLSAAENWVLLANFCDPTLVSS